MKNASKIWLEVTNVRSSKEGEQETLEIQVKGDRAEREPEWWNVSASAYTDSAAKTYRTVSENLDKKRIVLAGLGPVAQSNTLECKIFRIQYADSNSR
jgi:hypothetical protein